MNRPTKNSSGAKHRDEPTDTNSDDADQAAEQIASLIGRFSLSPGGGFGKVGRQNFGKALATSNRLALVGLIAANCLPILLALIFGWNVYDVVMFYWWENIIIGIYSICRILMASNGTAGIAMSKLPLVLFFTFHYFFFCFIHLIFLRLFFQEGGPLAMNGSPFIESISEIWQLIPQAGLVGLMAIAISHGMSFFQNYIGKGEYKKSMPMLEMFRPYGRIVVMHVCIIFGGFAVMLFGSPIALVVLLMLLKTAVDLVAHVSSHASMVDDLPTATTV